ncbi:hypothetical protein BC829DRAFT_405300 [Chytridium lagenaria]|nr:hypothetical protein BC829DRAFT_405300 [Chytridium lagenaria]
MGTKASRMSSLRSASAGTEEDDEAVPLVSVPVYMVRLPGNPAITPRDASFAAAVTSMVDEEDWEEDEVTGETEEFDEVPLAVSEVVEEIVEAAATTVSTDVEVSETAVKADVVEKEAIAEDVVEQTVTDVVGVDSEEQSMTETTTEIVEEKVYVTTIETVEVIETVEETKTEVFEEAAPEAVEVEAKEE